MVVEESRGPWTAGRHLGRPLLCPHSELSPVCLDFDFVETLPLLHVLPYLLRYIYPIRQPWNPTPLVNPKGKEGDRPMREVRARHPFEAEPIKHLATVRGQPIASA